MTSDSAIDLKMKGSITRLAKMTGDAADENENVSIKGRRIGDVADVLNRGDDHAAGNLFHRRRNRSWRRKRRRRMVMMVRLLF